MMPRNFGSSAKTGRVVPRPVDGGGCFRFRMLLAAGMIVLVISGGYAQGAGVDGQGVVFRVGVDLVTVDAIVHDRGGNAVEGLRKDDFSVFDNGAEQRITHFSHEKLPLAVALVIDSSPSIEPYRRKLRKAAMTALEHLKPEDEVALFSFDVCPERHTDLTRDRERIERALKDLRIGVGTNIYGALYDAAHFLGGTAPGTRRAIILISDNVPNVFQIGEKDALEEILKTGATLYSIKTEGESGPPPGLRPAFVPGLIGQGVIDPAAVARIAAKTGGEVLELGSGRELPTALEQAVVNLRSGYTLGFTPAGLGEAGGYHRLDVKLHAGPRCPDCSVQARAGYYAGIRKPSAQGLETGGPEGCEERLAYEHLRSPYARISSFHRISFKAVASRMPANRIRLDLGIDADKIEFRSAGGRRTAALMIAVFILDETGKPLGEEWKKLDLRLEEENFRIVKRKGIPFSTVIPLEAPNQILRVFVYDLRSRRFGMRMVEGGDR